MLLGWADTWKESMARDTQHHQGHDMDNEDGDGGVAGWCWSSSAGGDFGCSGIWGDGVDLGVNTCRARHRENKDEVWAGGRGARQVTASLSPPTVCSKIKSGPARCKSPRKTKLSQDDGGTLPLPAQIVGHPHRGLVFKVQADCWCDLRLIILLVQGLVNEQ